MAASLHSLSLEHINLILFTSHSGMFTRRLKFSHRFSFMVFSTVERLYKVKLRSGKRKINGDKHNVGNYVLIGCNFKLKPQILIYLNRYLSNMRSVSVLWKINSPTGVDCTNTFTAFNAFTSSILCSAPATFCQEAVGTFLK